MASLSPVHGRWLACALAVAIVTGPSLAQACEWDIGPSLVVPEGDVHPANAAVVIVGWLLDPVDLVATVDGEPVSIAIDGSRSRLMANPTTWEILTLQLESPPLPGQSVTVVGGTCGVDCGAIDLAWIAGDDDTELSTPKAELAFDLARYLDPVYTSCGDSGSVVRVRLGLAPDAFGLEDHVLVELTATHAEAGLSRRRLSDLRQVDDTVLLALGPELVGDAFPIDGWCVEASAVDAAGNRVTLGSTCEVCSVGEASREVQLDDVQFIPAPGGPCDEGTADTSGTTTAVSETTSVGDDTIDPSARDGTSEGTETSDGTGAGADDAATDRGCACDASGSSYAPWSAWALLVLAAPRRRSPPLSG